MYKTFPRKINKVQVVEGFVGKQLETALRSAMHEAAWAFVSTHLQWCDFHYTLSTAFTEPVSWLFTMGQGNSALGETNPSTWAPRLRHPPTCPPFPPYGAWDRIKRESPTGPRTARDIWEFSLCGAAAAKREESAQSHFLPSFCMIFTFWQRRLER